MAMNLSLLMITLITKRCRLTVHGGGGGGGGGRRGNKSCLKSFRGRKFRQRRATYVHRKMALPCILNKTAALSSKSILYFKLYATELLKPFR